MTCSSNEEASSPWMLWKACSRDSPQVFLPHLAVKRPVQRPMTSQTYCFREIPPVSPQGFAEPQIAEDRNRNHLGISRKKIQPFLSDAKHPPLVNKETCTAPEINLSPRHTIYQRRCLPLGRTSSISSLVRETCEQGSTPLRTWSCWWSWYLRQATSATEIWNRHITILIFF